jgi:hypothetical protein
VIGRPPPIALVTLVPLWKTKFNNALFIAAGAAIGLAHAVLSGACASSPRAASGTRASHAPVRINTQTTGR